MPAWPSEYFTLEELTRSSTAARLRIDNTPPADIADVLADTAKRMDAVRRYLNKPIIVDSGYRCPALNHAVGGVPSSAHLTGHAVDFICPDYGSPAQIVIALRDSGIKFDQLINEGAHGSSIGWVHISFASTMRQQVLTAHFGDEGTTYSAGVSQ